MIGVTADDATQTAPALYDGSTTESEYYDELEDEIECGVADGVADAAVALAPVEASATARVSAMSMDASPTAASHADAEDEYMADAEDDAVTKNEKAVVKPEPETIRIEAVVAAVAPEVPRSAAAATAWASTTEPVSECPTHDPPSSSVVDAPARVSAVVKPEAAAPASSQSLSPPVTTPVPVASAPVPPAPAPVPAVSDSGAPWQPPLMPVMAAGPPRFVSPFACLAVPLRPPPVVGPPPIMYPVAAPPPAEAARVPEPSAPSIFRPKCLKCRSELGRESNGVPSDAHSALCHCCLRYYAADIVKRESGSRLCLNCRGQATAAPVATPLASPSAATISVAATPTPAAAAVSRRTSTSTNVTDNRSKCSICQELVTITPPPTTAEGYKCNCCGFLLSANSFSSAQRHKPEYRRRCRTCVASESPAFIPHLRKLRKAHVRAQAKAKNPATPQEQQWSRMERAVGKILLAERSIARRRQSNDLRGASRVEYEEQLAKEEAALMKQAAKLRQSNAPLYVEVRASLDVQDGIAPRREQDRNLTATGRPKIKVTRTKAKSAIKNVTKKRSAAVIAAALGKHGIAPAKKKAKTTATATPKHEVIALDKESSSTTTSTKAPAAASVARTTRRKPVKAEPIEIIVIDDDD